MPKIQKWTADDFEVRTSTIEGAGMGLFAKHAIAEEDSIGYYTGEVITEKEFHDPDRPFSAYVMWVTKDNILVGEGPKANYTRYINHDVRPTTPVTSITMMSPMPSSSFPTAGRPPASKPSATSRQAKKSSSTTATTTGSKPQ